MQPPATDFLSGPLLPRLSQDLDGKYQVERVITFEVEGRDRSDSVSSEEDPLIEKGNEHVSIMPGTRVVRYFVHRHLRYLYSREVQKYVLLR